MSFFDKTAIQMFGAVNTVTVNALTRECRHVAMGALGPTAPELISYPRPLSSLFIAEPCGLTAVSLFSALSPNSFDLLWIVVDLLYNLLYNKFTTNRKSGV